MLFGLMARTEDGYADAELLRCSGISRVAFVKRVLLTGYWAVLIER